MAKTEKKELKRPGGPQEAQGSSRSPAPVPVKEGQAQPDLGADRNAPAMPADPSTGSAPAPLPSAPSREPDIDPEIASLIPRPSAEERALLEEQILKEKGCRDPIVVWNGRNIVVDGHNR